MPLPPYSRGALSPGGDAARNLFPCEPLMRERGDTPMHGRGWGHKCSPCSRRAKFKMNAFMMQQNCREEAQGGAAPFPHAAFPRRTWVRRNTGVLRLEKRGSG